MNTGHIKLHRSIEEWEWIDEPVMFYFWVRILLMANWEDRRWHGEVIERGSFVCSLSGLSEKLNLSIQQVRTCLSRLQSNKQIITDSTNKRTKVTICKYADYQGCLTNEQQTDNTPANNPTTTTKEEYNYNTSDTNVSSYSNSIQEEKKEKESSVTDVPEDQKRGKPVSPPPDFSFVLKLWNDSATRSIPKVRMLSPARKEKVRLRIKEMGGMEEAKEILATCFKKISESDFCNGATGKWTATFDWFFENEKNWLKVLEGNYDNRKEKSRLEQLAELYKQGNEYYEQQYRGYGGASPYGDPPGGVDYGPDEQ